MESSIVQQAVSSHLYQELSVGQNTVLIREGFPQVIKRGHAIPAKRANKSCSVSQNQIF